jgi:hypothetical protein
MLIGGLDEKIIRLIGCMQQLPGMSLEIYIKIVSRLVAFAFANAGPC